MSKIRRFVDKWIPILWGTLWVTSITALSIGGTIWSVKWLLNLVGVL